MAEWPAEQFVEEVASHGAGKLYDNWTWTGRLINDAVLIELRADDIKTDLAWLDEIKSRTTNEGSGSAALKLILDLADKHKITIRLYVDSHGPVNDRQLKKWYSRFGFKTFRGNHMHRKPR